MNSYELSRGWFDFAFENPEKIKPIHAAIFFFAVEHCNRLGWKDKFGFPSQMVMDAVGVKNWRTYSSALSDLVEFGFIELIEKSTNQYSSNIISLQSATVKNTKAQSKALDKALQKHSQKQGQSIVSIDKQLNKEQITIDIHLFEKFWNIYDKKVGREKSISLFSKLKESEKHEAIEYAVKYVKATPDKQYRKNPETYIRNKCWNDELPPIPQKPKKQIVPLM